MDKLRLHQVSFHGYHGALPEERVIGQTYLTSVTFELDTRSAGETDALDLTIDYRQAIAIIREIVTGEPVKLIETLAHRIAVRLLAEITAARAVNVHVSKPHPPVPETVDHVSIEIRRERDHLAP